MVLIKILMVLMVLMVLMDRGALIYKYYIDVLYSNNIDQGINKQYRSKN